MREGAVFQRRIQLPPIGIETGFCWSPGRVTAGVPEHSEATGAARPPRIAAGWTGRGRRVDVPGTVR